MTAAAGKPKTSASVLAALPLPVGKTSQETLTRDDPLQKGGPVGDTSLKSAVAHCSC